jgi:hypothetical protein
VLNQSLQVATALVMPKKTIGEFAKSRIFALGFRSQQQFIDSMGIDNPTMRVGKPTMHRLFDFETEEQAEESMQRGTREAISRALRFSDWENLVAAWRRNDVKWQLPTAKPGQDAAPSLSPSQSERPKTVERRLAAILGRAGIDFGKFVELVENHPEMIDRLLKETKSAGAVDEFDDDLSEPAPEVPPNQQSQRKGRDEGEGNRGRRRRTG